MKRTKKLCLNCNKEISLSNYEKHINFCNKDLKNNSINLEWKIDENQYKCPYCDKIFCKKGISTHIWRTHGEGINFKSFFSVGNNSLTNHKPWNKGLNKYTDLRIKKLGDSIRENNSGENNHWFGKHHSMETKKVISEKLSINNKGGRCKWFEVEKLDGTKIKVQGTWERDFSKVLNIIDENWIKPSQYQEHTFKWIDDEGIQHSYTPDFYSPKLKKYFEIKGYWWGNDKRKMELVILQNNINVEIIQKKELNQYIKMIN